MVPALTSSLCIDIELCLFFCCCCHCCCCCCPQSAYAVLSFYLLMPFVFMSLFTSDKRFFKIDTTARLYHPFQYYMAKVSVTLPFNVIIAVVFHLVYYGMIGMRHGATAMGQSLVISVLMGLTAMQVGVGGQHLRPCIFSVFTSCFAASACAPLPFFSSQLCRWGPGLKGRGMLVQQVNTMVLATVPSHMSLHYSSVCIPSAPVLYQLDVLLPVLLSAKSCMLLGSPVLLDRCSRRVSNMSQWSVLLKLVH